MAATIGPPDTLKNFLQLAKAVTPSENGASDTLQMPKNYYLFFKERKSISSLSETLKTIGGLWDAFQSSGMGGEPSASTATDVAKDSYTIELLLQYLPQALSALSFLAFQLCDTYKDLGGGKWKTSSGNAKENCQLNLWLKDDENSPKGFMKRGFDDTSLQSYKCDCLESKLKCCFEDNKLNCMTASFGLFLLCPRWNHNLLGHTALFLKELCRSISSSQNYQDFFKGICSQADYDALIELCPLVMKNIDHMSEIIAPLSKDNEVENDGKFHLVPMDRGIIWLQQNLKNVIKSLKRLKRESWYWTKEGMECSKTSGPFMYGFFFKTAKQPKEKAEKEECKAEEAKEGEEVTGKNGKTPLDTRSLQLAVSSLTASERKYDPESLLDLKSILMNIKIGSPPIASVVLAFIGSLGLVTVITYLLNLIGIIDYVEFIFNIPKYTKKYSKMAFKFLVRVVNGDPEEVETVVDAH